MSNMNTKNKNGKPQFKVRGLRWVMFAFFIVVIVFNYIDRTSISIAMPLISKEMNLNLVSSGILLSSFFWSYTLMQIPGGWLVDHFKSRKIVSGSIIGWGAVEGLTGFASSFNIFILFRMLLGIAEGPIQVGCNNLTLKWLTPDERGRGSTLIDSGGPLGAAIGAALVTGLIVWTGSWRLAFMVLGVLTVLVGVFAKWFVHDNPADHPMMTEEELKYIEAGTAATKKVVKKDGNILKYFSNYSPWMLLIAFAAYDAVQYGLLTWIPYYVGKVRHVSFAMTGVTTLVIFGCGFLGEMVVGQVADRWHRSGTSANVVMRTLFAIAGIAVTISFFMVSRSVTVSSTVIFLCIGSFFIRWGGLYWSVPQMMVANENVGKMSGAMNFAGNAAGIAVPIVIGWIAQTTGSFTGVFIMFASLGLIMAITSVILNYRHNLDDKIIETEVNTTL